MSDSNAGDKKGGVPSWQRVSSQKPLQEEDKSEQQPDSKSTSMLEQARKFLQDEEVKDAPTDKKIAFLESKGVGNEDIQELLGISRNQEATNTTSPSKDTQVQQLPPSQTPNSNNSQPSNPPPPQQSPTPIPPHQQTYAPPRPDQPPIITYPEFLTTRARPTPLITKPRLLTTLYTFTLLSLLLHGTSTYLVTPMLTPLTPPGKLFALKSTPLTPLIPAFTLPISSSSFPPPAPLKPAAYP